MAYLNNERRAMEHFSFDLRKAKKRTLRLDVLRTDGDTQPRDGIDQGVVNDYAEAYKAKRKLPPVRCVHDGTNFWLIDGFHRRFAADKAGLIKLECLVVPGTLEDARWCSYAANQDHGLMRSVDDKVRAVKAALKHPNAEGMSDPLIAEYVGVSHKMVAKYRQLGTVPSSHTGQTRRTGKDGKKRPAKPKAKAPAEQPQEQLPEAPESSDEPGDERPGEPVNHAWTVVKNRLTQFCDRQLDEFEDMTPQLLAMLLEEIAESLLQGIPK